MNLKRYFEAKEGTGVLATSDSRGRVDVAVYAKPHVEGKNRVAFIMKKKLSRRNLTSNPHAAYLFAVGGDPAGGVRLYLAMTGEETDQEKVLAMRKRTKPLKKVERLSLVHFKVVKARALIGDDVYPLT